MVILIADLIDEIVVSEVRSHIDDEVDEADMWLKTSIEVADEADDDELEHLKVVLLLREVERQVNDKLDDNDDVLLDEVEVDIVRRENVALTMLYEEIDDAD